MTTGVVVVALGVWFQAGWGGRTAIRWGDDLSCELASALAGWAAFRSARREPALRSCWILVGFGAVAWTLGQLYWCVYDLGLRLVPSIPSPADAGYLLLPVFACAALLRLPSSFTTTRARWALDGSIVGVSSLLLCWSTIIEPISRSSGGWATTVVALAYPVTDVVLLTATVLGALHVAVGQRRLLVLALSLALLAIADAWFSYLSVSGRYQAGALCDVTYVAAFAVMARAALEPGRGRGVRVTPLSEWRRFMLPYVPFAVASLIAVIRHLDGARLDNVDVVLWASVTVLVLARQALALVENRTLLGEVKKQKEFLSEYAMTDALTGLANRALFTDRVAHATALHARDMRQVSLCWVDLDDFKVVNDTYGHTAGDELLVKVAERLQGAGRAGDTIARLGGDEFAVLTEDGSDIAAVANRVHSSLQRPFHVGGARVSVTASIGLVVLRPEDAPLTAEELVTRADVAMYHAKNDGKNRIVFHVPGMTIPGADDLALRQPLRRAINNREIRLDYQPLYWADDLSLRGYEALARWSYQDRAIPAARFVALAERLGLGCQMGDHLLDLALAQEAAWSGARPIPGRVIGVNLSTAQLLDSSLPDRLAEMLDRHGVPASQLVLEITESALLTDSDVAIDVTTRLTRQGVELSLDDFGIGYSSLAHLAGFPFSSVKIDRSFVTALAKDESARQFIAAVIRLGRDLDLRVIIEGVETEEQFRIVRDLGCTLVQGFLFSPPVPPGQIDPGRISPPGMDVYKLTRRLATGKTELAAPGESGVPALPPMTSLRRVAAGTGRELNGVHGPAHGFALAGDDPTLVQDP